MFCTSFQPEKMLPTKEPGKYQIELSKIEEVQVNGKNVLRFHFIYVSGGDFFPNHFDVWDISANSNESQIKAFRNRLSLIFACFNLAGDLTPLNYSTWIGKRGTVLIDINDRGYTEVKRFYVNRGL